MEREDDLKIHKQGARPPPKPPPWYMGKLTCPECGTVFQLDSGDVVDGFGVHPEYMSRHFVVRTEKCLNGKSEVHGPCPFCKEHITIRRQS